MLWGREDSRCHVGICKEGTKVCKEGKEKGRLVKEGGEGKRVKLEKKKEEEEKNVAKVT